MEANKINWFPGHMAIASKKITESIKAIDLIIEVVDSRAINTTSNPFFKQFNKPVLKVALKSDLCDLKSIKLTNNLIVGSTKDKSFRSKIINKINEVLAPYEQKKRAKGLLKPTFYIMIVGLPNVGKSTLINFLANKHITSTGNMPAVTKKQTIIKISDKLFLQDNPGIFLKKVNSMNDGCILALLNTIKKEVLPLDDIIRFNYSFLTSKYLQPFLKYFDLNEILTYEQFISYYANKRKFVSLNGQLDINRGLNSLFDEFVNGNICKVNYES